MFKKYIQKFDFLIVWAQLKLSNRHFIFLSSVLVGISAALAVIVLKTFAHSVFTFAQNLNQFFKIKHLDSILPIIGILLTALVVKKVLRGKLEKGTSQIMYAVARKASILPKKQMYAQIITSSLTVGLGGSAGLESPITITGAAFGSNYAQAYKLSYKDRTLLLACGVAAGIAAAFNAPIAGVLFAIEVLLTDITITAFIPIMISAATGAIVSDLILKEDILLSFKEQQSFDSFNIPFYIILGALTGFISIYHTRIFERIEGIFKRYRVNPYRKALVGGLLLCLLIFIVPSLFGEGYESIKTLSEHNPERLLENTLLSDFRNNPWILLIFVGVAALLKVFATGITLGSGGNGGNFAPSLFVGSYVGFFFSKFINLTGLTQLPVSNFTIVGMAGVLSGLFHAPLTAIFLIGEITGGYTLMIPLMIVSSVSFAISKQFENHSMDIKSLAAKGQVFTSNKDKNILSSIETTQIVDQDIKTVHPEDNLEKLVAVIASTNQELFPIVNADNALLGVIYLDDIRDIIFNNFKVKYTLVKEIMLDPVPYTLRSLDSMSDVMKKFTKTKMEFLPVIRNGQFYGTISKSKILDTYRQNLRAMTIE